MAALTRIKRGDDVVHSNGYVDRAFRVVVPGADATDEWVVTGLSRIVCVLGVTSAALATGPTVPPITRCNAQGTGVAEGTTPGALGIACTDVGLAWDIVVRGIL